MTSFETIADALKLQLVNADVAQGRVWHALGPESVPSGDGVVISILAALPNAHALRGNPIDWNSTLRIEVSSRFGVESQAPQRAVTTIVGAVWAAIFADESIGGTVDGLLPGPISWDYSDDEKQYGTATMLFTVMHRTLNGAL